jgi:hypothetical protein
MSLRCVTNLAGWGKVTQQIRTSTRHRVSGFAPESNRLAMTMTRTVLCPMYDGTSLQQTAAIDLKDYADNIRYDVLSRRFLVSYGKAGWP